MGEYVKIDALGEDAVFPAYVEKVTNLMNGAGGIDQLQELGKQIAPMGQMGLQLFQQLIETGAKAAMSGLNKNDKK